MKKKLKTIFISISLSSTSIFIITSIKSFQSLEINCNFNSLIHFPITKPAYQCEVTNRFYTDQQTSATIESVTGKHIDGKTNDDVNVFEASMTNLQNFPQGIEKFFKNVKFIRLANNEIKQIGQLDLKPFPGLKSLQIQTNKIEIIEDELFKFNPDLETIWMSSNKIFHIGENAFKNLKNLTQLGLLYNRGINMAARNRTEIEKINEYLETECKESYVNNLDKLLMKLEHDSESLTGDDFGSWKDNLRRFEAKFNYSVFSNFQSMKLRIQALKQIRNPLY